MVRRGPPSAYAALIFWAGTPGICAYESRGIDTTLMRRCRGSKLTSINVSDREYGSTRRRSSMVESIPMTRTLTRCFRRNGQPNGRMAAGGVSALVVLVNALPCVVKYRATPAATPTKSIGQAIHGHRGGTSHLRGVVRRRAAPGRSGPAVGVSSCGLMVSGSKGMAPSDYRNGTHHTPRQDMGQRGDQRGGDATCARKEFGGCVPNHQIRIPRDVKRRVPHP